MKQGTEVMIISEEEEEKEFKKIIETLPKEERWIDQLDLYQYQEFWYPIIFLEGIISIQKKFKPQPTDIVLCSFPKTGTTWLKALSFAIATRNRFGDGNESNYHHSLHTSLPHDCIPFMEVDLVVQDQDDDEYKRDPKLPLLSTHVPYTSLPKSIVESGSEGCKVVYIWRDPKDTFVSLWHFLKNWIGNGETKQELCFDTEFDRFCHGKSLYGPFWDHVLGFWNASLECPHKVLFLKYEDMKIDTLFYVRKLAEFMNQPFLDEEENERVPQKIMEFCGFQNLSSLEVNKTGKHRVDTSFGIDNKLFFRKGEMGDWKTHLTIEMAERIDAITMQKFGDSGLR